MNHQIDSRAKVFQRGAVSVVAEKGVLVYSHGHRRYAEQAIALACSIRLHNPDLPIAVVTDQDPTWFRACVDFVIVDDFTEWPGWLAKMYAYDASPFERTLCLDSDMLVFVDLRPVFAHFEGCIFTVVEEVIRANKWFRSMDKVREVMPNLGELAFAGALYYWERCSAAQELFARARKWRLRYEELDIKHYGAEMEEVLFALAMYEDGLHARSALAGELCISLMWPQEMRVEQDVIAGCCVVTGRGLSERRAWMYYCGGALHSYGYLREVMRLRAAFRNSTLRVRFELLIQLRAAIRWFAAPPRGFGKLRAPIEKKLHSFQRNFRTGFGG